MSNLYATLKAIPTKTGRTLYQYKGKFINRFKYAGLKRAEKGITRSLKTGAAISKKSIEYVLERNKENAARLVWGKPHRGWTWVRLAEKYTRVADALEEVLNR